MDQGFHFTDLLHHLVWIMGPVDHWRISLEFNRSNILCCLDHDRNNCNNLNGNYRARHPSGVFYFPYKVALSFESLDKILHAL